jgi:lysophospholipase L1-like esterase
LIATALACVGALGGAAASAQASTLDLVLVGDSYTSGNGTGVYTDTTCFRSPINWGQRYAAAVRAKGITVNVTNAACGGAVVKDLDGQIAAITPQTDLVALTIGGNDVGFSNIVIQCFAPAISDPTRCKQAVGKARGLMPGVEKAALQRLDAVKARLRPGGKIIVLSYPYLAQPSSYVLRGLFDSYKAGTAVRQLGDLGDQTDLNAANAANEEAGRDLVTFVPTKDLFAGHEPNPDPYRENGASWVNEFTTGKSPVDIYHPKPQGYIAMSQAILRVAGPAGDFGVSQ